MGAKSEMKEKGKVKKYIINGFIAVMVIAVIGFAYYEVSRNLHCSGILLKLEI